MNGRIAVVEQHPFHFEMIPALLAPLRALGCTVDVFCHQADLGMTAFCRGLGLPYHPRPWTQVFEHAVAYDAVVLASAQCLHRRPECDCVMRLLCLPAPKLACLHLPRLLAHTPEQIEALSHRDVRPVALTGPARAALRGLGLPAEGPLLPVFPGPLVPSSGSFAVPGRLDPERRSFGALLKAHRRSRSEWRLELFGRAWGDEVDRLRALVATAGTGHLVEVAPSLLSTEFYDRVARAALVVAALNPSFAHYWTGGMSGSIPCALSCGVPVALTAEAARQYPEVAEAILVHADSSGAELFSASVAAELPRLRTAARATRASVLADNQALVASLLGGART